MRNLFIIGMLLVAASMAGWFKVQRDGERTTIEINRSEIRSDARRAIDRGKDLLDRHEQQYDAQRSTESGQPWPQEQFSGQNVPFDQSYDPRQQPYDARTYPPQQPYAAQQYNNPPYYPPAEQPYTRESVPYGGQSVQYPQQSEYPRR